MNYSIDIKPNRTLMLIAIVTISGIASGILWLSIQGYIDPLWRSILFYLALFFYALSVFGVVNFWKRKHGIRLTQDGFENLNDFKDLGLVPWSALKHIREEEIGLTKGIALLLDDPDTYLDKLSGFKKRIAKMNRMNYDSFYIIQSSTYQMKHKELIALFREKHEEFKELKERGAQ